jgi:hypothetical protein
LVAWSCVGEVGRGCRACLTLRRDVGGVVDEAVFGKKRSLSGEDFYHSFQLKCDVDWLRVMKTLTDFC